MARAYAGTVMLEGTTLSEGRGTTRPLELFGAPDINARKVIDEMRALAPDWLAGCRLRDCWFEPTFHKHVKQLCNGVQIHTEDPSYDHEAFRPWRVQDTGLQGDPPALSRLPASGAGLNFKYEYTDGHLAIDVINGGPALREWVDNPNATPGRSLMTLTIPDEEAWLIERRPFPALLRRTMKRASGLAALVVGAGAFGAHRLPPRRPRVRCCCCARHACSTASIPSRMKAGRCWWRMIASPRSGRT